MKFSIVLCTVLTIQIGVTRSQTHIDDQTYVGYGNGFKAVGNVKKVSDANALARAAKEGGKIIVSGKIRGDALIIPASNTHIVGDGTAELERVSFYIGSQNVTLQNLTMHLPCREGKPAIGKDHDGDLIHIEGSASNIWIDHCELSMEFDGVSKDTYDGLIDVKKGPGSITISWNYIHDAHKVNLVGHSDKDQEGPWRLSIHHNIFNNLGSRIPSIRGGKGSIFNNYYVKVKYTGVNSRLGAEVYCEKNYFDGVGTGKAVKPLNLKEGPIGTYYSEKPGKYNAVDNFYVRCRGNQPFKENSTTNYKPPFMNGNKTIIPVMDVPSVLMAYAGIKARKKTLKYPEGGFTSTVQSPVKIIQNQRILNSAIYTIRGMKLVNGKAAFSFISNCAYIEEVNGKWIVRFNTVRK